MIWLILSGSLSMALESFLTSVHWSVLNWRPEKNPSQISETLSIYVQLSFLHSPALGILLTLASMNSEYSLFYAERLLAVFKYSFPVLQPGNSLHAVNCGYCRVYLVHFPSLRDNYPLLPYAQCPRNCIYR